MPLILPPAPDTQTGPVKAWSQAVTLPTYHPTAPDRNPMFLDRRVYQGSSGRVYPLPFYDRIESHKRDRQWQALHLENEFIRVMILPEIGGRIHIGLDKTNGYDFFYRQNVIKPALVGLAGPWASGGVEFNWPQHHRPATFMPVDVEIEEHADGSRTIWCSDHDPMNRLKGMHGVCLHPGRSYIELKVRLYNRTALTQTFLWWANVATRVHEQYQSFFPSDVHYVADHAKRAMSRYPLCDGRYYGVDYAARARGGVPQNEIPSHFVPPGTYAPNNLSWYANIPVPTSYMAMGSRHDFFGGYDHAAHAGLIHVANHHIAPGKKQWTWGNQEFGYAWDRNLTDSDGPYIELMAGVYTDNQPDFSFLAPGETRTFSQFWYPIRDIGPAQQANIRAAVSLQQSADSARIGVSTTAIYPAAHITLTRDGRTLADWTRDLAPDHPSIITTSLTSDAKEAELTLTVTAATGEELIRYAPEPQTTTDVPSAATEPAAPEDVPNTDELYIIGLHLAQYRHATRDPEHYWREALRRDPGDSRCNNAIGLQHLKRGEFSLAENHFRKSLARQTSRNPNPYDGECYYNLGLALCYQNRHEDAYAAFYKSTWNAAWRAPAYQALAEIDARCGRWSEALDHLRLSLRMNADNLQARNLMVLILQKQNRTQEADAVLRETLALDPLDACARWLTGQFTGDNQTRLDVAFDLARAGFYHEMNAVLAAADTSATDGSAPIICYARAWALAQLGDIAAANLARQSARTASPDYCFPNRLEELQLLEWALAADPADARAAYYLGNLLYDRNRCREAIQLWERSAQLDPTYSVVWRNLGIGYFNIQSDSARARDAFNRALTANPRDARVLFERDQLAKQSCTTPESRLAELEKYPDLVNQRDDLSLEFASLLNHLDRHNEALALLESRQFQPWEGGEGVALREYVRTQLALTRAALAANKIDTARGHAQAALNLPSNLSEARHILANMSDVHYWLGGTASAAGDTAAAQSAWQSAASARGDFQDMSVRTFSDLTIYTALAMQKLGRTAEADQLLHDLLTYAQQLETQPAKVDYFATSMPTMLLFKDDLQKRQTIAALVMQGQALIALGRRADGTATLQRALALDPNHPIARDFITIS